MMIGETISHYKILAELGAGGMGQVYKAQDLNLGRTVALKFLPPQLSNDDNASRRFIHEAKSASALDHPNIGAIHEIGQTLEGRIFIAMAYYEGQSLRERLQQGPLEVAEAVDIGIQVASGLAKAHEKGITHRDIKPANIIITEDGQAKLIDFGLAKLAGQTKLTRTGTTVGTVSFMSPEQARGEEVDERSDIFSLGAVLYELVTGHSAFPGDHEAAVLYGVMNRDPDPISVYRGGVPERLHEILDRALKKEAGERYQTAAEMATDLEQLKASISTPTSAMTDAESGPWRFRPQYLFPVALVAIAIVVALVVFPQLGREPEAQELALAVVDFRDLATPDDPSASAGMTGLLQVGLVESSPIRVVSTELLYDLRRRHFGSDRGAIEADQALELARESGASLLLSGQMAVSGDDPYVTWQLVDTRSGKSLAANRVEGNRLAQLADGIIESVLPVIARESGVEYTNSVPTVGSITSESTKAYRHYMAGLLAVDRYKPDEALREFERAVQIDSTFALALLAISTIHYRGMAARNLDLALAYADKAWELRSRLGIRDRMLLEAWRYRLDLREGEARATYREILARWPDDLDAIRGLSSLVYNYWKFGEAGSIAEKGLSLYPEDAWLGVYYMAGLVNTGRFTEALEATRRFVERHPDNPNAWDELGLRFIALGMPDSAETAFRTSLKIDPEFTVAHYSFAYCSYARGDVMRAIDQVERYFEITDVPQSDRYNDTVSMQYGFSLAMLYAEAGQFENALNQFEKAHRYALVGDAHAGIELNRNFLLLRMGRAEEVLESARELGRMTDAPKARWAALRGRARALVALDSLDAAREVIAEIGGAEGAGFARVGALKATAEIALAENRPDDALAVLDSLMLDGLSPLSMLTIEHLETVARAHLMSGRPEEAARVHREIVRVYGGHALSHYDLGKIYEEMGRPADAADQYAVFLEMWSEADEGLPQIGDARTRLAALQTASQ